MQLVYYAMAMYIVMPIAEFNMLYVMNSKEEFLDAYQD